MPIQGKSKKKTLSKKGHKTGKNSKNNGKSNKRNNGNKTKRKRSAKRNGGKTKFCMDIFNEEVMENSYYTCHNIMDVLYCRGFPWPEIQKKKKKGKKR